MRKYFLTKHPTFGSYANPREHLITPSPYFWWWYALTLNEEYRALSEAIASGRRLPKKCSDNERKMRQVFADFGDVRYEGCRYRAFTTWWTEKLSKEDTRATYLFAEPARHVVVEEVKDVGAAKHAISASDEMLLVIPLTFHRRYINKALDRLLAGRLQVVKGRKAKDLSKSEARYAMKRAALGSALQRSFELYDARAAAVSNQEKVTNADLAKRVGLRYNEREKEDEVAYSEVERNGVISMLVSRHIASAKKMISNVGVGQFP